MSDDESVSSGSANEVLLKIRSQLGQNPTDSASSSLLSTSQRISKVLTSLADTQDDRVNFRINSTIKHEFESLCKAKGTTLSRELKRLMVEAIRRQML